MRVAKTLASVGAVVMALALAYGFSRGGGWNEVRLLTQYPWFNVSLIDVYIGFALFCGWVVFRETSLVSKVIWIVAIMALGNLVCCIYVIIALRTSQGDWPVFWLGRRSLPTSSM